jgi:hypothetical protein
MECRPLKPSLPNNSWETNYRGKPSGSEPSKLPESGTKPQNQSKLDLLQKSAKSVDENCKMLETPFT